MSLKIVIIDDEPNARASIRALLKTHCPETIVIGEASTVAEGTSMLLNSAPDLVLLDVAMPDGSGFDLLDTLPSIRFALVFTTASDESAIRAFRYNAVDYLMKPIDPVELAAAVKRAEKRGDLQFLQKQIASLLRTAAESAFDRIILHTGNGHVFTKTTDITRLNSEGNYTFVHLADGERCIVSRNLKEFEEMLPQPIFFRIHQSHIVNTVFVKKFLKEEGGIVVMQDGQKLPVARRRNDEFLEILQG